MSSHTGSRLASVFLGYLIGIVVLVTMVPFDFVLPSHFRVLLQPDLPDLVANLAMFLPLGFLIRLTRPPRSDRWAMQPLLAGLLLSALLETAQLFLPARFSSPFDLLANGAGAWLGAMAHDQFQRHIRLTPKLVGALALELPLMGLVYLLIPLLWLSGLASVGEAPRLGLSLLLGLTGAVALGAIHRYRLAPAGVVTRSRFALVAGCWFLIGTAPVLLRHPSEILGASLLVGFVVAVLAGGRGRQVGAGERRFEMMTLAWLAPGFALYLICLGGWPPGAALVTWHGELGLAGAWGSADTTPILRVLEQFSAFTVLGYLVGESRGRRQLEFAESAPFVACCALVAAGLFELIAAVHPGPGASLLRAGLASIAAVLGAGIYQLQREHIQFLLRGPQRRPSPPTRVILMSAPPARSGRTATPEWGVRRG